MMPQEACRACNPILSLRSSDSIVALAKEDGQYHGLCSNLLARLCNYHRHRLALGFTATTEFSVPEPVSYSTVSLWNRCTPCGPLRGHWIQGTA